MDLEGGTADCDRDESTRESRSPGFDRPGVNDGYREIRTLHASSRPGSCDPLCPPTEKEPERSPLRCRSEMMVECPISGAYRYLRRELENAALRWVVLYHAAKVGDHTARVSRHIRDDMTTSGGLVAKESFHRGSNVAP